MSGYSFGGYVVKVVDGDTIIIDSQTVPPDIYQRVRFKDVYAPELGDKGGLEAKARAEADFPVGSLVRLTNEKIEWSYNRLVARIDRA